MSVFASDQHINNPCALETSAMDNSFPSGFSLAFILFSCLLLGAAGARLSSLKTAKKTKPKTVPLSVNYHFTRKCNYSCGFCFHTAKTSDHFDMERAQRGLRLLREAGTEKINFSGGEPFLVKKGKHLGEMVRFCKEELHFPSVSVVSNGSLITEEWFQQYGECLFVLGCCWFCCWPTCLRLSFFLLRDTPRHPGGLV